MSNSHIQKSDDEELYSYASSAGGNQISIDGDYSIGVDSFPRQVEKEKKGIIANINVISLAADDDDSDPARDEDDSLVRHALERMWMDLGAARGLEGLTHQEDQRPNSIAKRASSSSPRNSEKITNKTHRNSIFLPTNDGSMLNTMCSSEEDEYNMEIPGDFQSAFSNVTAESFVDSDDNRRHRRCLYVIAILIVVFGIAGGVLATWLFADRERNSEAETNGKDFSTTSVAPTPKDTVQPSTEGEQQEELTLESAPEDTGEGEREEATLQPVPQNIQDEEPVETTPENIEEAEPLEMEDIQEQETGEWTLENIFQQGETGAPGEPVTENFLGEDSCAERQAASCQEHYEAGCKNDGLYWVQPTTSGGTSVTPFRVYCDQTATVAGITGGWALFMNNADGTSLVYQHPVTPNKLGALADKEWIALRDSMSTGLMTMDEYSRVSFLSIETLQAAGCLSVYDVPTLVPMEHEGTTFPGLSYRYSDTGTTTYSYSLYRSELEGCDQRGNDYCIMYVSNRSGSHGTGLYNFCGEWDIFPYDRVSIAKQNQMMYFLR